MGYDVLPDDVLAINYPAGTDTPELRTISGTEPSLAAAAFRQNNWIASAFNALHPVYKPVAGYNVVNDIQDKPQYWSRRDAFMGVDSPEETHFVMAQIDQADRDQQTLYDNGFAGTIAGFAAGLIDPINLLPAGEIVKGGQAGYSVVRSALAGAASNALAASASASLLKTSNPTMATQDVFYSIGGATLLGGILGGSAAKFLDASERSAAIKAFDDYRDSMRSGSPPPNGSVGAAAADTRELTPVGMGKVGQAYTAGLDALQKVPYVGKPLAAAVDAPAALVRNIGPVNRVAYGPFVEARRAMFDLADSAGILFNENLEGRPTVQGGGPSIETNARMAVEGGRYRTKMALDALYSDYRWGEQKGAIGQFQAQIQDMTGRTGDNLMTMSQFKEAISDAMRNGDKSEVPQVQEAAQYLRREIFEPWKAAAIDAKLLPDDVDVETADSYLNRLYDRQKIIETRPQFEGRITQWLTDQQNHNAEIQRQLRDNLDKRQGLEDQLAKIEGRQRTALSRYQDVEQRLSERQMEATATERRFDTVDQRAEDVRTAIDDAKQFAADLKETGNTSEIRQQIADLEREAKGLEGGLAPISEKDLGVPDRQILGVLTGPMRRVARILTGDAKMPKSVKPFWRVAGELSGARDIVEREGKNIQGRNVTEKLQTLLQHDTGIAWDDLQAKLMEEYPELRARWQTEGLAEDHSEEIRDLIRQSLNGKEPDWYVEQAQSSTDKLITETVRNIEAMQAAGELPEFNDMRDVADFLSGKTAGMTAEDYDRMIAEIEQVSGSMDRRVAALDVQHMADVRRESLDLLARTLKKAKDNIGKAKVAEPVASARVAEAGIAARRNMSRAEILDRRSQLASMQHDLLEAARQNVASEVERLRAQAEELVREWKGKSAAEAASALERRGEAERIRGLKREAGIYEGKGARFTSADKPVDSAIRRMLKANKDLSPQELKSLAVEIVDRILSTPDGRLPYDAPSGGPVAGMAHEGPPPRGPLAARNFMIPDNQIREWLVNDAERLVNSYLHTMVPDTLIAKRFGSTDMLEAFKKIRDEHTVKRAGITDPQQLAKLDSEYRASVRDLAGVRDRLRHVYGATNGETLKNAARVATTLGRIVNLADMGGSGIAQFNDLVGAVMRYGFMKVFRDGWVPYFRMLASKDKAVSGTIQQWRALGVGAEMALDTRPIQEIGEDYHPHTRLERGIKAAADYYMIANGSAPITTAAKSIASLVSSSEILRAVKASVEGKATKIQLRNLGESSITPELAQAIYREFDKSGHVENGVLLPNTGDWTDNAARLAFEGAVSREVNIAVVTPGQEKSLWLSHPIGRLIGQFKAFTSAATTRMLLAGMQRRDISVLQGMISHVAMGMLSYKAYSIVSGRDTSDRPQDWIKEGISRSGVFGTFDDGNALLAKFSAGKVDAYRMIGADKPLAKYMSRSAMGQLMGPSWGLGETAVQAIYGLADGKIDTSDVDAVRRLLPLQNFFLTRQLLDKVDQSLATSLGGSPRGVAHH